MSRVLAKLVKSHFAVDTPQQMLYTRRMNSSGIGQEIRRLRLAAGKSQVELASAIDVHWTTISRWERGISVPIAPLRKLVLAALVVQKT